MSRRRVRRHSSGTLRHEFERTVYFLKEIKKNRTVNNNTQAYNEGINIAWTQFSVSSIGSNDLKSLILRRAFKCRVRN